jgi:DNA-directed RNA polymerase subunit beta'
VSIHDKHIQLIVRQMLRRVLVAEPGDAPFLPGERVDSRRYATVNRELVQESKRPAEGRPELMGITKASLATDSWLSAASFQETTRVLTEAAIESRSDRLFGLKENIIIGKLIPAGTGMSRYREIDVETPEAQRMTFWSPDLEAGSTEDLAAWLRDVGGSSVGDGHAEHEGDGVIGAEPAYGAYDLPAAGEQLAHEGGGDAGEHGHEQPAQAGEDLGQTGSD